MYADKVPIPSSKDQWDYVQLMSNNLRSTFDSLSTVFSPACIAHEVLLERDWISVQVEGVTLPDALECWASSLPNILLSDQLSKNSGDILFPSSSFNHELLVRSQLKSDSFASDADPKVDAVYSINSKSQSMLADAPRVVFDSKLNSNHVRKIVTPMELEEEKSKNSISHRAGSSIRSRQPSKVLNNRTDRRRSSKYSTRDERRRKRKRLQRRLEKCKNGNDNACEKLRKHHGKDIFEDDPIHGGAGRGKLRRNSNLVRSLDRRSSRKNNKKDKTNADRKKRKTARQRNLERRRAKQLRKQKRKQQRRERKRRQREKAKKRREMRKLRLIKKEALENNNNDKSHDILMKAPFSTGEEGKHHLKVRSVQQEPSILSSSRKSIPKKSSHGQCRAKLIDDCSWPHCNRSCPKLKNPKTGMYKYSK